MADYTKRGPFVPDLPPAFSPAVANAMEDGIKDAAEHHRRGTLAARPPASALNKNHVYWAYDTGERFLSDGATWNPLPVGTAGLQDGAVSLAKLGTGVTALLPSAAEKAAMAGEGDSHAVPSSSNPFLTKDDRDVRMFDLLSGTTLDMTLPSGLWICEAVYGFVRAHATIGSAILVTQIATFDGATKFASIMASTNRWSASSLAWSIINDGTPSMQFRMTVGGFFGQIRVFATRLTGGRV